MKGLIFIGDRHCLAAKMERGSLDSQRIFPNSEEGRREFERYLDDMKDATFGMLADFVEEDYRIERVPHLGWRDRKPFHEKKLNQYYRHTPFRNVLVQGREGKSDRILFSALTNPNLILPWIESMAKRQIALSGIASVAMLSEKLVGKIHASHFLLLSFQNGTGLRQSFFLNGSLNFSRLTLVRPEDDPAAILQIESERLYKYLHALNLLPGNGALQVSILCGIEQRKLFGAVLEDTSSIHYVFLDLKDAAKRIGFRGKFAGSDALPLFLHLLGRGVNQYGSEEHTHTHDLRQWQYAAYALSASLVIGGLSLAGIDVSRAVSLHGHAVMLNARADAAMNRYRELVPPDSGPDSPQKMKAAVLVAEKVESAFPPPRKLFAEMSRTLDAFPGIRINRFSWQVAKHPESVKAVSGEIGFDRDLLEKGPNYLVIFMEGEIFPFAGNYRQANETVDRFCGVLEKEGMRVAKIGLPLDLNPDAGLVKRSGQSGERAAFSIRAVWKVGS